MTRISESTWIRRTPSGLRWDVYLRGDLVATFLDESAATWFAENYPDDAEAVQS
ncbi:hypothetical protein PP301_gp095 [Gordonia phage GMA2]|uniref:Uncharacterized protein n=1 Tax=Gordonia phage GMA2 TaxID=1647283 RepID=A0A0K0N7A7_9CAUD|nr:hypothetical protein PP301_gp095 [Gordonia phage GMA2]AKJ72627.1 hypothetical protein GMA2_89 [Gordonia phage GMA2]